MPPKTKYCRGEPGEFPEDEFEYKDGGWVHMTSHPHYINGQPWKGDIVAGIDADIPDDLEDDYA